MRWIVFVIVMLILIAVCLWAVQPAAAQQRFMYRQGVAQQKASHAAIHRIRGHVGGSLGGYRYEGIGWSSHSLQDAIRRCCYWGKRRPGQIGVQRGPDGVWYATVLYQ